MNIIILDLETTGLDPKADRIIEVGCILYSVDHATPISSFASLVNGKDNAAEATNQIPGAVLATSPSIDHALGRVADLVEWAEIEGPAAFVAHRADFDRGFLEEAHPDLAARLPWICSKFDVEWPSSRVGASCVEMALAHGVPVVKAHRALTDCDLIASTLTAVAKTHDLAAILERAMRPKAKFVSLAPFEEKEVVKAAGFQWDGAVKEWSRRMAIADASQLPFAVRQVTA